MAGTTDRPGDSAGGAGLKDYLKEAFFFRWNVVAFLGATVAAALSPIPGALLPLVLAAEMSYLAGLISIPRFRRAIDAKRHARKKSGRSGKQAEPPHAVEQIVTDLPAAARKRFERLRARCLEMRSIAQGVGGRSSGSGAGDTIRAPALNRLLWVLLRLLVSQNGLTRFLEATNEGEIRSRLEQLERSLAAAEERGDERISRSLRDSIAASEMRLSNHEKAVSNAEFVNVELDRIEEKIRALTEMSVSRQDPDMLSRQVDSVAESMRQTEKAMSELQLITGLTEELEEPPPILEADIDGELNRET